LKGEFTTQQNSGRESVITAYAGSSISSHISPDGDNTLVFSIPQFEEIKSIPKKNVKNAFPTQKDKVFADIVLIIVFLRFSFQAKPR